MPAYGRGQSNGLLEEIKSGQLVCLQLAASTDVLKFGLLH